MISRSIESAQKRVEARNFDIRKHVLEYDDVMNQQREVIYKQRMQVLRGENLKENVLDMIHSVVDSTIDRFIAENQQTGERDFDLSSFLVAVEQSFLPGHNLKVEQLAAMKEEEIRELLHSKVDERYELKEADLGPDTMRELERMLLLRIVDEKWMDHLDAMDQLRQGIGLRAYGQKDPLIEYKFEGYEMFNGMIEAIKEDMARLIFRVTVVREQEKPKNVVENRYAEEGQEKKPVRKEKTVGRNDPCPCGSGKKYKKCCGK
jgi:preprotein translocase subunit SecA